MSMERAADEYFSSINSIAKRMYVDMNETKVAYDELWDTISEKQKKEILSESIITPEVLFKYKENKGCDIKEFAVKLIIDDHCSYQDEHSGPFSFKTRSQRNLCLFEKDKGTEAAAPLPKHKPRKLPQVVLDEDISKFVQDEESNSNTLPKTGLDFLDNW